MSRHQSARVVGKRPWKLTWTERVTGKRKHAEYRHEHYAREKQDRLILRRELDIQLRNPSVPHQSVSRIELRECIECPVHGRADKKPIRHWKACDETCRDTHAYWERTS